MRRTVLVICAAAMLLLVAAVGRLKSQVVSPPVSAAPFVGSPPGFGEYHFGMTPSEVRAIKVCPGWRRGFSSPLNSTLVCDRFPFEGTRWTLTASFLPDTLQTVRIDQSLHSVTDARAVTDAVLAYIERDVGRPTSVRLTGRSVTTEAIWDTLAAPAAYRREGDGVDLVLPPTPRVPETNLNADFAIRAQQKDPFTVSMIFAHHPVPPPMARPLPSADLIVDRMTLSLWRGEAMVTPNSYVAETFHPTVVALSGRPAPSSTVIVTLLRLQPTDGEEVDFERPGASVWLRLFAGLDGERQQAPTYGVAVEPLSGPAAQLPSTARATPGVTVRLAWPTAQGTGGCFLPTRFEEDSRSDHGRIVFNAGRTFASGQALTNCTSTINGFTIEVAYRR
jgi:hypothetical protein